MRPRTILAAPADGRFCAQAIDSAGNAERTPHEIDEAAIEQATGGRPD